MKQVQRISEGRTSNEKFANGFFCPKDRIFVQAPAGGACTLTSVNGGEGRGGVIMVVYIFRSARDSGPDILS